MFSFSNPHIAFATAVDKMDIIYLINSAYRGESSKQGWTTEAHLIAGETRTDVTSLEEVMNQQGSVIVKYIDGNNLIGCVNLQQHGDKIYLGMFSVAPKSQGEGIGKKLLMAAEEYALHLYCKAIYMSVIGVRTELINWYMRRGYQDSGGRKPFQEDGVSGKHLQQMEFMILEKAV